LSVIKNADHEHLGTRDSGIGILFSGSVGTGTHSLLKTGVEAGDQVLLKKDSIYIVVEDVKKTDEDGYARTISGFENPVSIRLGNLEIGDQIKFREPHIFTCGKA